VDSFLAVCGHGGETVPEPNPRLRAVRLPAGPVAGPKGAVVGSERPSCQLLPLSWLERVRTGQASASWWHPLVKSYSSCRLKKCSSSKL
jgi:hypothetical protein